jgi:hypothetical protein
MGWFAARMTEGTSMAGIGIAIDPIMRLVSTGGADISAWGQLAMAIAAFCFPEAKKS